MAETNRVIIHHQGAGAPSNSWGMFTSDYSIAIGTDRIEVRNSPANSFRTTGTSGPSLQICLSGNRDEYPVTDQDLTLIGQACAEAEGYRWIPPAASRVCQFHGDTASTACPGSHTRERREDIYAVVLGKTDDREMPGGDDM